MRIVAGHHGSRRLNTLKGQTTRPTTDKIRGAIFNRIGPYFDGGKWLDGFAGSGAMALEALSRGFEHATLIEKDFKAFKVIQSNLELLNETAACKLIKGDAQKVIAGLCESYDVVFLDPPYAYDKIDVIAQLIVDGGLLKKTGHLILETDPRVVVAEQFGAWHCVASKDYGNTLIRYFEYLENEKG